MHSSSCPRSPRCWRTDRPRRASGWPTASSATSAGSTTPSSRSRSIISPARRRTTSRCASAPSPAGLTLNEYALTGPDGPIACRTEAELFAALGLAEIPPELREDTGEIEAAEAGRCPTGRARRPDRHVPLPHRLERRRRHARRDGRGRPVAGLQYLGIADHSRSARLCRRADHRARPRAMGGDRRPERDVRQRSSTCSRGPSATSCPTARSIIPTSCSTASTTWSRASIRNFSLPRDEMTRRLVRAASNPQGDDARPPDRPAACWPATATPWTSTP